MKRKDSTHEVGHLAHHLGRWAAEVLHPAHQRLNLGPDRLSPRPVLGVCRLTEYGDDFCYERRLGCVGV